ncbi:MAG: hypothetical protein QW561_03005 [Candidatus Aenigmatarchaeota archaeon]
MGKSQIGVTLVTTARLSDTKNMTAREIKDFCERIQKANPAEVTAYLLHGGDYDFSLRFCSVYGTVYAHLILFESTSEAEKDRYVCPPYPRFVSQGSC